jgi:hypothetical protein
VKFEDERDREDGFSNAGGDVGSAVLRMSCFTNNTADKSSIDAGEGREGREPSCK